MRLAFTIGLIVGMQTISLAQSSNISTLFLSSYEKAERMYQHLAYRNALELYLYAAERDPENYKAKQRIADCYFRLGNVEEAEKKYAELANLDQGDPIYKYQYAQVLSIQGKYGDAEKWFRAYANSQKEDKRAQGKLDFIYSISYYFRDSVLYTITPEAYNSDQSDFAPHYHKDKVVFVSARDRDLFIKKKSLSAIDEDESHLNVYVAPKENALGDEDVLPFYHSDLNSTLHDGPITFFDGEKQIAFTRNNSRNGKPHENKQGRVNLKLFFARLNENDQMTHMTEFDYNNEDYSVAHPWVSEDGNVLYFASDKPGGIGGVDLYRSERLQKNKWSEPVNLGPNINTMGDEFSPFLVDDKVLYFASNGHGGLGGLDIFSSMKVKDAEFGYPTNLGFPLNSSGDDFALILDESKREGLFSSNRAGGLGYDDIYRFKVNQFFLTGKVIERADSLQAIPNAEVIMTDTLGAEMARSVSDANGIVHFDLDFDAEYGFKASKDTYSWVDSLRFSTFTRYLGGDSILIPLWKQSLFAKGSVYSNESQNLLKGATVRIDDLDKGTSSSVVVDDSGLYQFDLQPNTRYRISAGKEGFIESGFNLDTRNIFKGDLVNDFLLEEVFVEKAVVQFDFDKSELKPEAVEVLQPVLKTLKKNKKYTLNIGAHADSFGTHEYNQSLSDRRAKAVTDFFIANGIVRSRIEAIGFGEELLINRCSNGVECTEEEHSLNRRAEIKAQLPE